MTPYLRMGKIGLMKVLALTAAMIAGLPTASWSQAEDPDPMKIDVADAIECRLDAPTYNALAFSLDGEDKVAERRKWTKIPSRNMMMAEYQLPAPITVAGHYTTRHIALTSSGILAVLNLPDPRPLAKEQGIVNAADASPLVDSLSKEEQVPPELLAAMRQSGKFLGEKVVSDKTEKATTQNRFGAHTVISRNISTVTTHPGKTLYGCSYKITLLDKNGNPL